MTAAPMRMTALGLAFVANAAASASGFTSEFREALLLTPDAEHGRALYATCAACHQSDGAGRAKAGVPVIAAQHYRVILQQLVDYRERERADDRMEVAAAAHVLKGPQDLVDVAAYIADLQPVWTDEIGPGEHLADGQSVYDRSCLDCHGVKGEGNAKLRFPRLAGQHYSYLQWQIRFMLNGDRANVTWDHILLLESLTPDEVSGLSSYLARLK